MIIYKTKRKDEINWRRTIFSCAKELGEGFNPFEIAERVAFYGVQIPPGKVRKYLKIFADPIGKGFDWWKFKPDAGSYL